MKIARWTAVVATGVALALTGAMPAAAEQNFRPYADVQADGCEVTLEVTSPEKWRENSQRTWDVFLVVDTGAEQPEVQQIAPGETVTVGPYDLTEVTLSYRVFGGAERDDDSPALAITHEELVAYLEEHGDAWLTGGVDEVPDFVGWHTVQIEGCEVPTSTPSAVPSEPPAEEETPAPGEAGELPTTGVPTKLVAAGAAVLVILGAGLYLVARRRRVNFEA